MNVLQIDEYQIILQNLGEGKGKIIIASPYLNTSYFWGAMGCTIEDFVCSIDSYYWVNKLLPIHTPKAINTKKTFANFRKHLFEEALYCYPWYDYKEFHKTLREEIARLQGSTESEHEFIDSILSLPKRLNYFDISSGYEREAVQDLIMEACSEPWHFFVEGESKEQNQLMYIHKQLKKQLKEQRLKDTLS